MMGGSVELPARVLTSGLGNNTHRMDAPQISTARPSRSRHPRYPLSLFEDK
jgi:hypothetical protein